MNKKVSVIIPTYRRQASLSKAITSLLNQSYGNLEIIVIDDNGFNDYNLSVYDLITNLQKNNDNIVYIKNEINKGSAESRNIGIRAATGDFITFLDDDDIYKPDKVKLQLEYMLLHNLDVCFTDLILKNENDQIVDIRTRENISSFDKVSLIKYHLMFHITGTDTLMYRQEILKGIGGFDPIDVGDEFYLMMKTIQSGAKIGYLPGSEVIAYVHNNQGGLSTGETKIIGENALFSFKKKYFDTLSAKEIRYIKYRHYAVLAFANYKRKKYLLIFVYSAISFIISPLSLMRNVKDVCKLFLRRNEKR